MYELFEQSSYLKPMIEESVYDSLPLNIKSMYRKFRGELPDPLPVDGLRDVISKGTTSYNNDLQKQVGVLADALQEVYARLKDRTDMWNVLAVIEKALSAPLQPVAAVERIKEVIKESGGMWKSCSGCHETVDGQETGHYDYSNVYSCYAGSGCHECGGIGVVWDDCNYSSYGQPVAGKSKEEIREIAYIAWQGAANAFRIYPDNKHTFADYWDASKDQFNQYGSLRGSEWDCMEMVQWANKNMWYYDHDEKLWKQDGWKSRTSAELYILYKSKTPFPGIK